MAATLNSAASSAAWSPKGSGLWGWRRHPRASAAILASVGFVSILLSLPRENATSQAFAAETDITPVPPVRWIDISRPFQIYTLDQPEFAKTSKTYAARRQENGAGREDVLTFGHFGGSGPFLHIGIRRFGNTVAAMPGLYVEAARRAAESGLSIGHSASTNQIASRFGALDYADVTLESGGVSTPCQAFRLAETGPDLNVSGIYCAANSKLPEPGLTVCLLDRLGLAAAGEDVALRGIFGAAELKREQYCSGGRYRTVKVDETVEPLPTVTPPVEITTSTDAKRKKRRK